MSDGVWCQALCSQHKCSWTWPCRSVSYVWIYGPEDFFEQLFAHPGVCPDGLEPISDPDNLSRLELVPMTRSLSTAPALPAPLNFTSWNSLLRNVWIHFSKMQPHFCLTHLLSSLVAQSLGWTQPRLTRVWQILINSTLFKMLSPSYSATLLKLLHPFSCSHPDALKIRFSLLPSCFPPYRKPGDRWQKWTQCRWGKCLVIGPCPKQQVSHCSVSLSRCCRKRNPGTSHLLEASGKSGWRVDESAAG